MKKANAEKLLLLVALILATNGCIMYRAKALTRYGIKARVIDADAKTAVAKAKLSVCIDDKRFKRKTSKTGRFAIRPAYRSSFILALLGLRCLSVCSAQIEISAEGYYITMIPALASSCADFRANSNVVVFEAESGYLKLGDIQMKRRQPPGAQR